MFYERKEPVEPDRMRMMIIIMLRYEVLLESHSSVYSSVLLKAWMELRP